jgi:hypothetical protein
VTRLAGVTVNADVTASQQVGMPRDAKSACLMPKPHLDAQRLGQGLVAVELDLQHQHVRVVRRELAQLRVQRLAAAAPGHETSVALVTVSADAICHLSELKATAPQGRHRVSAAPLGEEVDYHQLIARLRLQSQTHKAQIIGGDVTGGGAPREAARCRVQASSKESACAAHQLSDELVDAVDALHVRGIVFVPPGVPDIHRFAGSTHETPCGLPALTGGNAER